MNDVEIRIDDGIATLTLTRGKVNALGSAAIAQLDAAFRSIEGRTEVRATILTGSGKFFSYGFDVPEIRSYSRDEFAKFFRQFTDLYTYMFLYPKPVIASINGHAVAGGCMLALACDRRIMVDGHAKIALNEIAFGSSVFAGAVEMLRLAAGGRGATEVLYSGAMYTAREAERLGLIDEVASESDVLERAVLAARELGSRRPLAFSSIKRLLRKPIAEVMASREQPSIDEMVEIWSTEPTRSNLKDFKIY